MDKLLLRVPEAAELTGVGRSMAYHLAASGQWPVVRIGRSVRVVAEGLRKWVEDQQREEAERQLPPDGDVGQAQ
jgi:excisionase family DNA binding protein